jgi:hypothetical protein
MNDHRVADFRTLRIKSLLNRQRTFMAPLNENGSFFAAREPQAQLRPPLLTAQTSSLRNILWRLAGLYHENRGNCRAKRYETVSRRHRSQTEEFVIQLV